MRLLSNMSPSSNFNKTNQKFLVSSVNWWNNCSFWNVLFTMRKACVPFERDVCQHFKEKDKILWRWYEYKVSKNSSQQLFEIQIVCLLKDLRFPNSAFHQKTFHSSQLCLSVIFQTNIVCKKKYIDLMNDEIYPSYHILLIILFQVKIVWRCFLSLLWLKKIKIKKKKLQFCGWTCCSLSIYFELSY